MRRVLPLLLLTATASAEPAAELRFTRVVVDYPTDATVRSIVDELDGFKVSRALETCARPNAQATVDIRYRERRVEITARSTDRGFARCIEGALRLTPRPISMWMTAELSTVSLATSLRTTRQSAGIRIDNRVYAPRYNPDETRPRFR